MCGKELWMVAILFEVAFSSSLTQLPDYLKKCSRDVKVNECLKGAIEDGFIKLKKGDPSLGVQEIDPLKIDKIVMSKSLGLISLDVDQRDAVIRGFSEGIKLDKVDFNFQKKEFTGSIHVPKLLLSSFQTLKGKILGIPITWRGNMECHITKVKCNFIAPFQYVEADGSEHAQFNVKLIKLNLSTDHVKVRHIPKTPNDKLLASTADRLINDNWKLVFNLLKSSYEDVFRKELGKALTGVFSSVPLSGIFT